MRALLVLLACLLVVAFPASAATVDPQTLVLAKVDLPSGFRVDVKETGLRTNELEAKEYPPTRQLFARWKRTTGYQARYRRGSSVIEARVDLFRAADGARRMLEWIDLEARKAGFQGQKRAPVRIADAGWMHWVPGGSFTLVIWRDGRSSSGVFGRGITRERALALARAQQRRIAAPRSGRRYKRTSRRRSVETGGPPGHVARDEAIP